MRNVKKHTAVGRDVRMTRGFLNCFRHNRVTTIYHLEHNIHANPAHTRRKRQTHANVISKILQVSIFIVSEQFDPVIVILNE